MAGKTEVTGSTSAQLRGDIQAGITGDKQPGFDPAMAPLETDAEAGGVALPAADVDVERKAQRSGKKQEVSADHGSAMRPVFSGNRPHYPMFWPVVLVCLAAICFTTLAVTYLLKS
ncbi:hypothetical protein E9677_17240 [Rhizobium rhizophilum]|uniref:Transmembrane protein n=1 Tax=Rhizobium rhizophilum TaxID=1850373 RepID=A0ABY2QSB5_9HYPH|nr:hypothetical protein E9677_17240 [Rhizobium rhizophilum]